MHSFLQRFWADRSGNILILTGLGFLFLVGIGGAGHDLGKQQLVRQRIQQASDAASVAAAGMTFGETDAKRTTMAQNIYNLNYPDQYLGITRPPPNITITTNNVVVDATTNFATSFVGNLGVPTLTSAARSQTQIKKPPTPVDLILVMDNSGSMAGMDVGSGSSLDAGPGIRTRCISGMTAYFALFGITVTPAIADAQCGIYEGATGSTRLNALRFSANDLVNSLLNPNPLNHRIALVTWDRFLIDSTPFSNTSPSLTSFLLNMYGRGQTNSTVGLTQAQTLAAGFRSGVVPVVILMTDGSNFVGAGLPDLGINASSLAICNTLKTSGALVYTIGFGAELSNASAASATSRQFLSDCATGPNGAPVSGVYPNQNLHFFVAPSASALNGAFSLIINTVKNVRILN